MDVMHWVPIDHMLPMEGIMSSLLLVVVVQHSEVFVFLHNGGLVV